MSNLLDFFNEYEKKYNATDIHNIKKMYDKIYGDVGDYVKLQFELRTIFAFVDTLEPKQLHVDIDEKRKDVKELEFNPTLSNPNIFVRDKIDRDFCIWYKPVFYYPYTDTAKFLMPDFVMIKGDFGPIYNMDPDLEKRLYMHEYLTGPVLKDLSIRLLSRMKPIHTVMYVRKNFLASDLKEIQNVNFFLKPNKTLLISEEYMPGQVKMNLPLNTYPCENVDMNSQKFKDLVKRIV